MVNPQTLSPTLPHVPPQALVIGGGVAVGRKLRDSVRCAQQLQWALVSEPASRESRGSFSGSSAKDGKPRRGKVGVNKLFFRRLLTILQM